MRIAFSRILSALLLTACGGAAQAANELALYVFRDNNPAADLTVALDDREEKNLRRDGGAYFDLSPGGHSVQIRDNGKVLHTFRFDSAPNQLVDISVSLQGLAEPRVRIEPHFKNETAAVRLGAATGTVLGRVTSNDQPVANAEISVSGTGTTVTTDAEGNYKLVLPRGIYNLTITSPAAGATEKSGVRVVANVERGTNFLIGADSTQAGAPPGGVEEILIMGKYSPVNEGVSEQFAQGVVDTLGITELSRFGDSEVSAAVVRIPAVTVVDNQFVFIRGLGGRYISTTLNRATLPSPDPVQRTVPLDLFPTNMIDQLDVRKTFIASMPGESTGGNLVINTRTFPAEGGGQIGIKTGFTSNLTGDKVNADPISGDLDWLGFDNGTREDNAALKAIGDTLRFADFYPPIVEEQLRQIGGLLLQDDWDLDKTTANPILKLNGSYGTVFNLEGGNEFGFFVAGNYKNEWTQEYEGRAVNYNSSGEATDDFDFTEAVNELDLSGLISLGYIAGNNAFNSNTLYSNNTESSALQRDGFDNDSGRDSLQHTIDWVERSFVSQQFTGNHILGSDDDWAIDWQVTGSRATRDAPQRRDVRFDKESGNEFFDLQISELAKRYDDLVDDNFDGSADIDYNFSVNDDISSVVSFGGSAIRRERDSDSETYGYFTTDGGISTSAPNLSVNDVINTSTISGNPGQGFAYLDKTLASDSYDADLDLYAGYVSLDSFLYDDYQVIVGARYEDFKQTVNTFSLEGAQERDVAELDESSVLPSLAFNWILAEQQQLRFAVSKTISRPDFKELSNAVFYDPDFDIRVRGNPNLQTSDDTNFDVRYEYYWDDRDSFSVAGFYKDLEQPIERVIVTGSGTAGNTRTFVNADSGEVYGVELDVRREFGLNDALTRTFFIYGNYSWIESSVDDRGRDRSLQGQPDYTVNLVIGFDDINTNQEVTLLLNQNGDTIVDVAPFGQPDIVQEPTLSVDLNYKYYFADDWQFDLSAKNLLNDEIEYTQGGQTWREYKTGRVYEVGFNWSF